MVRKASQARYTSISFFESWDREGIGGSRQRIHSVILPVLLILSLLMTVIVTAAVLPFPLTWPFSTTIAVGAEGDSCRGWQDAVPLTNVTYSLDRAEIRSGLSEWCVNRIDLLAVGQLVIVTSPLSSVELRAVVLSTNVMHKTVTLNVTAVVGEISRQALTPWILQTAAVPDFSPAHIPADNAGSAAFPIHCDIHCAYAQSPSAVLLAQLSATPR